MNETVPVVGLARFVNYEFSTIVLLLISASRDENCSFVQRHNTVFIVGLFVSERIQKRGYRYRLTSTFGLLTAMAGGCSAIVVQYSIVDTDYLPRIICRGLGSVQFYLPPAN